MNIQNIIFGTLLMVVPSAGSIAQNVPQIRLPKLVQPEKPDYTPDDMDTYAVYDDFHTVLDPMLTSKVSGLQANCRNFCLWNEDSITCLGYVTRNDWNREYHGWEPGDYLEDEATGERYMMKRVRGLPYNKQFMVQSPAGSFVTFVLEFERIPDTAKSINYVVPPSPPIKAYGSYSGGYTWHHMPVELLKANTAILKYVKVKVVK